MKWETGAKAPVFCGLLTLTYMCGSGAGVWHVRRNKQGIYQDPHTYMGGAHPIVKVVAFPYRMLYIDILGFD